MIKRKITIHPLTKIFLIFILGFMIVSDTPIMLEALMVVLVSLLFIHDRKIISGVKVLVIFLSLLFISTLELNFLGRYASIVLSLCFIVRRFALPIMAAKYAINSTPTGVFMESLEKLKIPKEVTIPLAVMFRFFPSLREEFVNIKNAMRMRGISLSVKNIICSPVNCLEYVLVPMLASSSKLGDELAAAAHTKSVDDPCKKVRFKSARASVFDALIVLYLLVIFTMGMWR